MGVLVVDTMMIVEELSASSDGYTDNAFIPNTRVLFIFSG